jgi:hypothetical protein
MMRLPIIFGASTCTQSKSSIHQRGIDAEGKHRINEGSSRKAAAAFLGGCWSAAGRGIPRLRLSTGSASQREGAGEMGGGGWDSSAPAQRVVRVFGRARSCNLASRQCRGSTGICREPYTCELVEFGGEWRCPHALIERILATCPAMPGTRQGSRRLLRQIRSNRVSREVQKAG